MENEKENERKMNGNERKMNRNERKMKGNERKINGNERKINEMPLGEQQVARLPREIEAQRRGAQVARQRRTSRPLQSSKSRACHAK